jgi:hypothetical protein
MLSRSRLECSPRFPAKDHRKRATNEQQKSIALLESDSYNPAITQSYAAAYQVLSIGRVTSVKIDTLVRIDGGLDLLLSSTPPLLVVMAITL